MVSPVTVPVIDARDPVMNVQLFIIVAKVLSVDTRYTYPLTPTPASVLPLRLSVLVHELNDCPIGVIATGAVGGVVSEILLLTVPVLFTRLLS